MTRGARCIPRTALPRQRLRRSCEVRLCRRTGPAQMHVSTRFSGRRKRPIFVARKPFKFQITREERGAQDSPARHMTGALLLCCGALSTYLSGILFSKYILLSNTYSLEYILDRPDLSPPATNSLPQSLPPMSRRQPITHNPNLCGGLPFPTPKGRRQPARPLRVRKSALSEAQSKSESWHQQRAVEWLKRWGKLYPALLRSFHVANEFQAHDVVEKVNRTTGRKYKFSASSQRRKAEGVMPGMFDLINLAESRGYSALAVDLKVRDEDLREEPDKEWDQVRERAWLISQNKSPHTAWSWAEVAALHAWYFEIKNRELWRSIGSLETWLIDKGGHDNRCCCAVNLQLHIVRFIRVKTEQQMYSWK